MFGTSSRASALQDTRRIFLKLCLMNAHPRESQSLTREATTAQLSHSSVCKDAQPVFCLPVLWDLRTWFDIDIFHCHPTNSLFISILLCFLQVWPGCCQVPPKPSLHKAEQDLLPQPFLPGQVPQPFTMLVAIMQVHQHLTDLKLETIFHVCSNECWVMITFLHLVTMFLLIQPRMPLTFIPKEKLEEATKIRVQHLPKMQSPICHKLQYTARIFNRNYQ